MATRTLRRRPRPESKPSFEFTEAIAMEHLRTGFVAEIARGTVYPIDHPMVRQFPEYFRAIGPRVDQLEEVT
jgi:hypothetical protein